MFDRCRLRVATPSTRISACQVSFRFRTILESVYLDSNLGLSLDEFSLSHSRAATVVQAIGRRIRQYARQRAGRCQVRQSMRHDRAPLDTRGQRRMYDGNLARRLSHTSLCLSCLARSRARSLSLSLVSHTQSPIIAYWKMARFNVFFCLQICCWLAIRAFASTPSRFSKAPRAPSSQSTLGRILQPTKSSFVQVSRLFRCSQIVACRLCMRIIFCTDCRTMLCLLAKDSLSHNKFDHPTWRPEHNESFKLK